MISQWPQWEISVAISLMAKLANNPELVRAASLLEKKKQSLNRNRQQQECNGGRVDIISQILVKNEEARRSVRVCFGFEQFKIYFYSLLYTLIFVSFQKSSFFSSTSIDIFMKERTKKKRKSESVIVIAKVLPGRLQRGQDRVCLFVLFVRGRRSSQVKVKKGACF